MNKFYCLLMASALSISLYAQKPDKNKYDGYYPNIPIYQLSDIGYQFSQNSPEFVSNILEKDTLSLSLKGFEEGKGLSIVFYSSEPTIKASVEKETKKVNDQSVTSYYSLITAKSESRVLILNEHGLPIEAITATPNMKWVNTKGFSKGSYDEAKKDLESRKKRESNSVRTKYVRALIKAYQAELDSRYGIFARKSTMRVFSIKAKKFNYDDFNAAISSFIEATSSENVNSEASQIIIKESIAVWEKYASEYQPGKKTKVCDVNMDEINFNLAMGYLAMGKGEKLKDHWNKCLEIKGNMTAEGYAKYYLPQMIENHEQYLAKKDKPREPINLTSKEQQYNDMILLKTLLNFYLTEKHGNLGVISEYFPAQRQYLSSSKTVKAYDEGTKETITQNYTAYGKIESMIYTVEGGMNDDKTRRYSFKYNKGHVSEVVLNGNLRLFSIKYANGLISEIKHHYSNNRSVTYKFSEAETGKTEIRLVVADGEKVQESRRINWVKYDENYNVTSVYISPYLNKELKYDQYGNIIEMTAVNLADNTFTMPLTVEVDNKGNAAKIESKGLNVTSTYKYMF